MTWRDFGPHRVWAGDNLDALAALPDNSVDAVVTDPPYGLSFMGRRWDYDVPTEALWREVLRVAKPGAHLLSFGGSRTFHRIAVRVEDAGWELRDTLMWIYGSGYPKSHNYGCKCRVGALPYDHAKPNPERELRPLRSRDVPEAVDASGEREQVLLKVVPQLGSPATRAEASEPEHDRGEEPRVAGRRDDAQGEGELHRSTVCEVPVSSSRDGAGGWLRDGAPADGCAGDRASADENGVRPSREPQPAGQPGGESCAVPVKPRSQATRGPRLAGSDMVRCDKCGGLIDWQGWGTALKPAHEPIIMARKPLDGTVAANVERWGVGGINVDGCRVEAPGETITIHARSQDAADTNAIFRGNRALETHQTAGQTLGRWPANVLHDGSDEVQLAFAAFGESKPKPGRAGRKGGHTGDLAFGSGGDALGVWPDDPGGTAARFFYAAKASRSERGGSMHPTVKPLALMRYLVRLVTPPGGTVLDPFTGSGTTMLAADAEGLRCIGAEREHIDDVTMRWGKR